MTKTSRKRFTGIAWYSRSDWDELKQTILDSYKLPERFDVWENAEQRRVLDLEDSGFTVQKICIVPEEFSSWCQFRGQSPTMTAVLLYVAERIKPTPDARRVDGRRRNAASPGDASSSNASEPGQSEAGASKPAPPPQLSAREKVAQLRPDLAMLFPAPA